MTLEVAPERIADAFRRRDLMLAALRAQPLDVPALKSAMLDGVVPLEFVVGRWYRLIVAGAPAAPFVHPPEISEDGSPISQAEKLTGLDLRALLKSGAIDEITGIYRGRASEPPIFAHVFVLRYGQVAVFGDADILASERL